MPDPIEANQSAELTNYKEMYELQAAWEEAALFSHGPGAARNNYHIQAENEANTVKGRTKRW